MSDTEARNTDVVRRYFDGCNTGDLQRLLETLAPDVVHYFLPARFPPVRGAEALARFWQRSRERFGSRWTVDRVVAQGDEVVFADALQHEEGRRDVAAVGDQVRAARGNGVGLARCERDLLVRFLQEDAQPPLEHIERVLDVGVGVPGNLLLRRDLQLVDAEPGPLGVEAPALDFVQMTRVLHRLHRLLLS